MRPRILDLFAGGGGSAVGYARAGFDVVGVDLRPQPDYPFELIVGDALTVAATLAVGGTVAGYAVEAFDAVNASPPCQAHTTARESFHSTNRPRLFEVHPDLVDATRHVLDRLGLPSVIENVPGAPVRPDVVLCGTMFGLGADTRSGWRELRRHRLFEVDRWTCPPPPPCRHDARTITVAGHGGGVGDKAHFGTRAEREAAMGIGWITERGRLSEAIPPAYTEWIGDRLRVDLGYRRPRATVALA